MGDSFGGGVCGSRFFDVFSQFIGSVSSTEGYEEEMYLQGCASGSYQKCEQLGLICPDPRLVFIRCFSSYISQFEQIFLASAQETKRFSSSQRSWLHSRGRDGASVYETGQGNALKEMTVQGCQEVGTEPALPPLTPHPTFSLFGFLEGLIPSLQTFFPPFEFSPSNPWIVGAGLGAAGALGTALRYGPRWLKWAGASLAIIYGSFELPKVS